MQDCTTNSIKLKKTGQTLAPVNQKMHVQHANAQKNVAAGKFEKWPNCCTCVQKWTRQATNAHKNNTRKVAKPSYWCTNVAIQGLKTAGCLTQFRPEPTHRNISTDVYLQTHKLTCFDKVTWLTKQHLKTDVLRHVWLVDQKKKQNRMAFSKIDKSDCRSIFDDNLPKRTKIWGGKVERNKNHGSKPTTNVKKSKNA